MSDIRKQLLSMGKSGNTSTNSVRNELLSLGGQTNSTPAKNSVNVDRAIQQTLSQNSPVKMGSQQWASVRDNSPVYSQNSLSKPSLMQKATGGSVNTPPRAQTAEPKQPVAKTVLDVADRGAGNFNRDAAAVADFLANLLPKAAGAIRGVDPEETFVGQVFKPVTDATGKFKDYLDNTVQAIDARIQNDTRDSKVARIAADIGSAAVSALPNAVLAFLSGGASAAGTLAPQATGAAATASAAAKKLVSNPMFKVSAAQTLGSSYDDAKNAGATDEQAIVAAVLSTAFNSAVEVGGGVETLPGALRGADLSNGKKALQWVSSMLDEGKEEVVQGVISGLTEKAVFDENRALYSTIDENAVVNPGRMAMEFGMGAAVGGLLGGGQVLADAVVNRNANTPLRQASPATSPQGEAVTQVDRAVQETLGQNKTAPVTETETESTNINSVGAASSGFDPYSQASNTYGAIKPGENPVRVVDVPKSMDGETNVMQTVRTIMEADVTPDAAIPVLENEIVKGSFSAMPITDQAAAGRAEAAINRVGYDQALADWRADVRAGRVSKDSVAVGETLYNAAVSAGDTKSAVKIAIDLATQVRSAAQALQAVRMLKKMSPAAQLYGVKQSVDNLQKQLQGQYGDRAPDLQINETLAANFLNAKTDAERTAAEEALYKDIARQIPANFSDKWNAWRYLSMLGNPRTHIRNIIGNAAFAPVRGVKNQVGGLMEAIAQRAGIIDESQRTKSVGFNWSKKRRALVKAAKADYVNAEGQIQSGDKYNSATDIIEKNRRIFDLAFLETLRRGNSAALDVEDQWFSKGAYASSLAGYLNARGYTAEDFTGKGMTEQQKNDARAYAILEAQKATYRDLNALSELVTSMRFKNPANSRTRSGELAKRAANTVVEGVLPFKKTPANILARAVEYSPAGLAKALTVDSVQVAQGKISAAEYMDHLASGLTGSGLFALGYFLAQSDLLVGGGPEDEDQFNLENRQPYALEVGGTSVTLDWLAPEALPVFMGVELCKAIEDVNGQAFSMETMKSFFRGVTGPLLEMSMLSGLQDALDAVSYADDKMTAVVANAALGYLGQAMPTLFGQVERIIGNDAEIRQTTFTQDGKFLDKDTQYALGNALNKVPFRDFQQIPYIDAWGRTESTGGVAARAANNLLNPAYVSQVAETPVDAEIKRLEEQTGKNLTPARAEKVLTVDGEKILLTADEYVTYATAKGQNDYTFREHLIGRENYAALDDKTKAKAMEYAKEYADALAREETGLKADMPEWMSELEGAGIEAVTQRFVEKAVESMAGDKKLYDNKYDGISGLLNDGTIDDKVALAIMSDSAVDNYMAYCKNAGVSAGEYAEVIGHFKSLGENADALEDTLDFIDRNFTTNTERTAVAQALYHANPKIIVQDNYAPKQWLAERGADHLVEEQFGEDQTELYNKYIKGSNIKMEDYLNIRDFKENGKNIRDANGKTTYSLTNQTIDEIDRLNYSKEDKRNLFLGVGYSEKNIPYWWK